MRHVRKFATFLLVAGVGMATATGASAQQPEAHDHDPIEITEELLERFVKVYPSVMGVAQEAQMAMSTVETAEEAQAIQTEAQQQITMVLAEAEVTVQQYEAVVMHLNEDEEMRGKFEQMLQEYMARQDGR